MSAWLPLDTSSVTMSPCLRVVPASGWVPTTVFWGSALSPVWPFEPRPASLRRCSASETLNFASVGTCPWLGPVHTVVDLVALAGLVAELRALVDHQTGAVGAGGGVRVAAQPD